MPLFLLLIFFLFFTITFIKVKSKRVSFKEKFPQKISLIIAAKNEEQNIKSLIDSLVTQNYETYNYEVIIVDDSSTDKTFTETTLLTEKLDNFKIIKAEKKIYEGKRGALQIGIENSKHEYILITDADCVVEKNFLLAYSNKFQDDFDFIFGVAPYYQNKELVNKIACYDNLWVHILTFGFANNKLPYSAAARSFGFKKSSFMKIKGYKNTRETLSGDDDLLLREAVKNKMKIGTITEENAFVHSKPEDTFKEFVDQKSRHTSSSNYYSFKIKFMLGFWHFVNILIVLNLILNFSATSLTLLTVKLIFDIIIVRSLMKTFGYKFSLLEIIYLQIIYEMLLIVYFVKGLFSKKKW
ncbi:MAG: hypothetical protein CR986_04285 [Ignavibacteriae bacterium]|nr:MAG: hypothetical protein CR986_04285 [Ignavibacteriota bacterium]